MAGRAPRELRPGQGATLEAATCQLVTVAPAGTSSHGAGVSHTARCHSAAVAFNSLTDPVPLGHSRFRVLGGCVLLAPPQATCPHSSCWGCRTAAQPASGAGGRSPLLVLGSPYSYWLTKAAKSAAAGSEGCERVNRGAGHLSGAVPPTARPVVCDVTRSPGERGRPEKEMPWARAENRVFQEMGQAFPFLLCSPSEARPAESFRTELARTLGVLASSRGEFSPERGEQTSCDQWERTTKKPALFLKLSGGTAACRSALPAQTEAPRQVVLPGVPACSFPPGPGTHAAR